MLGDGGSAAIRVAGASRWPTCSAPFFESLRRTAAATPFPPTIPSSAPPAPCPEIWSYGLRNPWRFSFDPANGDLYIADVGQGEWEEVSIAIGAAGAGRGLNFGWKIMEGPECFGASSCDQNDLELPVLEYGHDAGCSITGGFVYRGSAIPALQGHYFYSDFCRGWVRSFRYENGAAVDQFQWPTLAPGGSVPGFGQDAAGRALRAERRRPVFRIVPG